MDKQQQQQQQQIPKHSKGGILTSGLLCGASSFSFLHPLQSFSCWTSQLHLDHKDLWQNETCNQDHHNQRHKKHFSLPQPSPYCHLLFVLFLGTSQLTGRPTSRHCLEVPMTKRISWDCDVTVNWWQIPWCNWCVCVCAACDIPSGLSIKLRDVFIIFTVIRRYLL